MSQSTTLPPTPELPDAVFSSRACINNVSLWYAAYGPPLAGQTPVIFLHGGKISSRWWGNQIRHLVKQGLSVIVVDTRGHGRSTDDPDTPLSYHLFADDIAALVDHLGITVGSFVGWSDGANTCLALAMRHRAKVQSIFAFGPNYCPDQAIPYVPSRVPFLEDLMSRMKTEYQEISATPELFDTFKAKVVSMQQTYPNWTAQDFRQITSDSTHRSIIVWIVTGDSEELIQHHVAKEIATMIEGSVYVELQGVGHFAPLQDAVFFNRALDAWLS
ncbi:hypothetical protein NQ176_g2486 [Zarea fungicola]|uniref:Uncharacterized protein n=1 Tax=Zarea fungicola TaxID=93591 RepID=A0ACC1NPB0_9HYPO|nr:hypothetical protein NQ176_g2486 [Lecanicillium fungicola]